MLRRFIPSSSLSSLRASTCFAFPVALMVSFRSSVAARAASVKRKRIDKVVLPSPKPKRKLTPAATTLESEGKSRDTQRTGDDEPEQQFPFQYVPRFPSRYGQQQHQHQQEQVPAENMTAVVASIQEHFRALSLSTITVNMVDIKAAFRAKAFLVHSDVAKTEHSSTTTADRDAQFVALRDSLERCLKFARSFTASSSPVAVFGSSAEQHFDTMTKKEQKNAAASLSVAVGEETVDVLVQRMELVDKAVREIEQDARVEELSMMAQLLETCLALVCSAQRVPQQIRIMEDYVSSLSIGDKAVLLQLLDCDQYLASLHREVATLIEASRRESESLPSSSSSAAAASKNSIAHAGETLQCLTNVKKDPATSGPLRDMIHFLKKWLEAEMDVASSEIEQDVKIVAQSVVELCCTCTDAKQLRQELRDVLGLSSTLLSRGRARAPTKTVPMSRVKRLLIEWGRRDEEGVVSMLLEESLQDFGSRKDFEIDSAIQDLIDRSGDDDRLSAPATFPTRKKKQLAPVIRDRLPTDPTSYRRLHKLA